MSILNTTNVVTTTHLLFKCFYFWRGAVISEEIWLKGKMALKNEELKWLVSDDELRYPKFSLDTINYSLYVNKFGHNSVISQWFKCNFFSGDLFIFKQCYQNEKKKFICGRRCSSGWCFIIPAAVKVLIDYNDPYFLTAVSSLIQLLLLLSSLRVILRVITAKKTTVSMWLQNWL